MMVGHFVEVCRKRDLKVNADKNKVMGIGGEEGLGCKIHVDGARLSIRVQIFGVYILDTDDAKCCRKVASGRKVDLRRCYSYGLSLLCETLRVKVSL